MTARPHSFPRRVPRRDRRWAQDSLDVLLSGVDVGGPERVAENLTAALDRGTFPRLGWDVRPDAKWYRTASSSSIVERVLQAGPPLATGDFAAVGRFVTELSSRDDLPWPLAVLAGDDYLAVRVSHLVGDGATLHRLFCALAGRLEEPPPAPVAHPYATAVSRFVRQNPRAVPRLLRARPSTVGAEEAATPVPFRPAKQTRYARMDPDAFGALKRWRKQHGRGTSLTALAMVALVRALREAGVSVRPAVGVLFDLRRYLRGSVEGNFVVAVDHDVRPETSPVELAAAISATAASGRPLATYAAMMAARRRPETAVPEVEPVVKLTFSSIGRPREIERLPWTSDLAPGYLCAAEPAGGNGMTAIMTEVGGPPQLALTFHASVVPAAAVVMALERLTRDPLALLDQRPAATLR